MGDRTHGVYLADDLFFLFSPMPYLFPADIEGPQDVTDQTEGLCNFFFSEPGNRSRATVRFEGDFKDPLVITPPIFPVPVPFLFVILCRGKNIFCIDCQPLNIFEAIGEHREPTIAEA